MRIVQVDRVRIERAHRADQARQHGHRVGIAAEPAHEELHLLVDHRVARDEIDEVLLLPNVRQLAVEQQVARLEIVAANGELLDRIAAVEELALVAVDVGDCRAARGRRHEARVVRELAGLRVQRADVDHVRTDRSGQDREGDGRRAVGEVERRGTVGHRASFGSGAMGCGARLTSIRWGRRFKFSSGRLTTPATAQRTPRGSLRARRARR